MKVLAIESTCDETAAAVVEGDKNGVSVLANTVASSSEIHAKYGGIIPEVAAREQMRSIIPVVSESMIGIDIEEVDAIAVSYGPGLVGSLLIGIETAKSLALAWDKPLIKVNHLEAHIAANWILDGENRTIPDLPAVGLIISGGHTDIVWLEDIKRWKWIGGTLDDAAGEAFDKAARALGLAYPGGPSVQKAAETANEEVVVNKLPRPMIRDISLNMSFSGLKAAVAKESKGSLNEDQVKAVALEFNKAVAEVLVKKTEQAIKAKKPRSFLVAGGVAANKMIRERLTEMAQMMGVDIFIPELRYCGDNAAMVGAAAILRPQEAGLDLKPEPSLTAA